MFDSHRPRLSVALRVFVLGLLALGLVMKPVLASIGELHELAHDPTGTHALADHGDHASQVSQDEITQDESRQDESRHDESRHDESRQDERGADTLHALVHFALSCGQSSLATLPAIAAIAASPSDDLRLMHEPQVLPRALSLAPFRPPIAA